MMPFAYERPTTLTDAVRMASEPGAMLYAGGTTMLDLMKLGVYRPRRIVDITFLEDSGLRRISVDNNRLYLGALVTMHAAAEHEAVKDNAPVVSESLWLAASQQLRHMATLGGNVMQRTRDPYFRDPSWLRFAKGQGNDQDSDQDSDQSGAGYGFTPYDDQRLAAVRQPTRLSAMLGTTDTDTMSYPGDFAQSLVAFDAQVEIMGLDGSRVLAFSELHVAPTDRDAQFDFVRLSPGEIITGFTLALTPALSNSLYIKARDRESYAFANASAAVGLEMQGDTVSDVRIALGGVATIPWRARAAEDALRGGTLTAQTMRRAGEAAFAKAKTHPHNAFKVPLGINVIVHALTTLQKLEG
nr:FAD binding domain-containing protein [uncultured Halomonas sp.]